MSSGPDATVVVTLISTVGGIAIAYITNVLAKKVRENQAKSQPKDRMEQMFDGYERLIKQKDLEDDRKQKYIQAVDAELQATKQHVSRLEDALEATNKELTLSRAENIELKKQLDAMRKEYRTAKADGNGV